MIVALAGLPGSGKSYLAEAVLKENADFVLFNKDTVRQTLFPGTLTDFSSQQDDLCLNIIFQATEYVLSKNKAAVVFIDGRTFSKKYQVEAVLAAAKRMGTVCKFIECVCADKTAEKRLVLGKDVHSAKNRNFDLYVNLKKTADALEIPHLRLCTDDETKRDERVREVLAYVTG